jgi:hypothetical protein
MFAFGTNVVFEELPVTVNALDAVSASATVKEYVDVATF